MSIMGKQINLGQLLSILVAILIPLVGWQYRQSIEQTEMKKDIESTKTEVVELKDDKKETGKKLDTIILMLTDVKVQVAGKQDRR